MTPDSRPQQILEDIGSYEPSPDLFARVASSIDEDRRHRRRVMTIVAGIAALVVAFLVGGAVLARPSALGEMLIPVWAAELMETMVMAVLILTIGPALRRFGGSFVRDVFRNDDESADRFMRLMDLAYYLVFGGIVLFGVDLAGLGRDLPASTLLGEAKTRLATLVVAMGVLHATTVGVLPVIGLILSASRWTIEHRRRGTSGTNREAIIGERLVRVLLTVLGVSIAACALAGVVAIVLASVVS